MNSTNNFRSFRLALGATIGLWIAGTLHADTIFTYQGELNENGNLANGLYDMDFSLWDALAGGNQVGSTFTINDVQVTNGRFIVELDFGANALSNNDRWLEVAVNATTLVPRQPITRVPYAIQTRGLFVDENKNVGIGVTNPLYPLHVESDQSVMANFDNTLSGPFSTFGIVANVFADEGTAIWGLHTSIDGAAPAILGETLSTADNASGIRGVIASASPGSSSTAVRGINFGTGGSGIGVWGSQDGDGFGVYGSTPTGIGVYGYSTATIGGAFNEGVRGQADDISGTGVKGLATATTGPATGVMGISASESGGVGVFGHSTATAGGSTGVLGRCDSSGGTAVRGFSTAPSGLNYGVSGTSVSSSGSAIFGSNTAETGTALFAEATGLGGRAVLGHSTGSTGIGIGVMGASSSAAGYDFYAFGAGIDYGSSSSRRWKHNVENIDQPLAKLAELRGVYFDWDQKHGGRHDVGMIAEDVGKILPEIVQYEANGIDAIGMDYSKLTPLLVEAVNALRAEKDLQIESQSSRINQLSEENNKLNARLDVLEELFSQIRSHL